MRTIAGSTSCSWYPRIVERTLNITWRRFDLAAFAAGLIFPLGFAPFYLWPVSLFSVGLFFWVSTERTVWRYFLFAFGSYLVGTSWIYVSIHEHGNAPLPLAGFLVFLFVLGISLPWMAFGWLQRWLNGERKPAPMGAFLFASLWLLREWTYTWFLGGFPWLLVGYTQVGLGWRAPFSGMVPVVGVLTTGFLLVLVTVTAVSYRHIEDRYRKWSFAVIGVLALSTLVSLPMTWVSETGDPIRVSLVQGNIEQSTKWDPDSRGLILNTYLTLSEDEWGREIVVWPEASLTFFRDMANGILGQISQRAESAGSSLILGLPDMDEDGHFLNAAIAIGGGNGEYFKKRLVAFGEYVPFEDQLRGLITFFNLPMSRNVPGPAEQPPLTAGELTISMSICFEIVFPELVRNQTASPDLLVTISNDTWFGASLGPDQHMQMAQARAMENGRYLLRSTNNGITGVVAPNGHVSVMLPRFEAGVLRAEVYAMDGDTPYRTIGDLPSVFLTMLVIVLMVATNLKWNDESLSMKP